MTWDEVKEKWLSDPAKIPPAALWRVVVALVERVDEQGAELDTLRGRYVHHRHRPGGSRPLA